MVSDYHINSTDLEYVVWILLLHWKQNLHCLGGLEHTWKYVSGPVLKPLSNSVVIWQLFLFCCPFGSNVCLPFSIVFASPSWNSWQLKHYLKAIHQAHSHLGSLWKLIPSWHLLLKLLFTSAKPFTDLYAGTDVH